jgi:hypothetical protein
MIDVVENPTKEEHGFEVLRMSIFDLQVCSRLAVDEVEEAVNKHFPPGTELGWRVDREGPRGPVECGNGGATHYMFSC